MSFDASFTEGSFTEFFDNVRLLCGDVFVDKMRAFLPENKNSGDVFHLGDTEAVSKASFSNADSFCGLISKKDRDSFSLKWFDFKNVSSLNICSVCFNEVKPLSYWFNFLVTCEVFTSVFPVDSYLKTLFTLERKRILGSPVTLAETEKVKEFLVYPSFESFNFDASALVFQNDIVSPFEKLLQRASNNFLVFADSDEFYAWSAITRKVLIVNKSLVLNKEVALDNNPDLLRYHLVFEYYEKVLNKDNFSFQDYSLINWGSWKVKPLSFEVCLLLQKLCRVNYVSFMSEVHENESKLFLFPVNDNVSSGSLKHLCVNDLKSVRLFTRSLNNFFEVNGVYFILGSSFLLNFYSVFTSVISVEVTEKEINSGLVSDAALLFAEGSVSSLTEALFVVKNV